MGNYRTCHQSGILADELIVKSCCKNLAQTEGTHPLLCSFFLYLTSAFSFWGEG